MSDTPDPHPVDENPEEHIGPKVADPWLDEDDEPADDAGEPVHEVSDGSDRVGPGGVSYVRDPGVS